MSPSLTLNMQMYVAFHIWICPGRKGSGELLFELSDPNATNFYFVVLQNSNMICVTKCSNQPASEYIPSLGMRERLLKKREYNFKFFFEISIQLNLPIYLRGDVLTELSFRDFNLIDVVLDSGMCVCFKSSPGDYNVQPGFMKTTGLNETLRI